MSTKPRRLPGIPGREHQPAETPSEQFIRRAPGKKQLPWKDPMVREDLLVQVNVKVPEKLVKMVEHFAHELYISKRQFVEDAIRASCQHYLREFGLEE